ncbi:MAG: N-acetylneuraminate synthase family protein [Bacteroidetes bacterium]|nr:N-acetylneuraminate synthase family protein [Bacteroidota bacterium]
MNTENFLNNPNHIFVIAEAGSNWKAGTLDEDLSRATKLIQIAAKSGSDAVKFQTYKAETVYVQNAGQSKYLTERGVNENIHDIFKKFSMPYSMLKSLYDECLKNNILFMSTPFSVSDAKEINQYVSVHKVASYELNHIRLLEFLAKTNKPIILSTGASNYEEIDFAIDLLRENGANFISLMQSTSKYPAPLESLNLSVIPEMKRKYNLLIGERTAEFIKMEIGSASPLDSPLRVLRRGV